MLPHRNENRPRCPRPLQIDRSSRQARSRSHCYARTTFDSRPQHKRKSRGPPPPLCGGGRGGGIERTFFFSDDGAVSAQIRPPQPQKALSGGTETPPSEGRRSKAKAFSLSVCLSLRPNAKRSPQRKERDKAGGEEAANTAPALPPPLNAYCFTAQPPAPPWPVHIHTHTHIHTVFFLLWLMEGTFERPTVHEMV